jgi:predicted ester cyclase
MVDQVKTELTYEPDLPDRAVDRRSVERRLPEATNERARSSYVARFSESRLAGSHSPFATVTAGDSGFEDNLIVRPSQARDWSALHQSLRAQLCAFLSSSVWAIRQFTAPYRSRTELPDRFAKDLAKGGLQMRAAFPFLTRTLERVAVSSTGASVTVTSVGANSAPFFDIFSATGRVVRFSELHELVVDAGVLVEDQVTLDVRVLVCQLACGRVPRDPSSSTPEREDTRNPSTR